MPGNRYTDIPDSSLSLAHQQQASEHLSMSISSFHDRRVAHGTQDFQRSRAKAGVEQGFTTLVSKPAVSADKLQTLARQSTNLSLSRQTASEFVLKAIGQAAQSIKSSVISGWKSLQPYPKSTSAATLREEHKTKAFKQLEKRFGSNIPGAESFLESRLGKPAEFRLFESFAQAVNLGESVEFLNAVSEFRSCPSVASARDIVKKFIEPSPVDDFGIPIEDSSKRQINMRSDHARNQLMNLVESHLSKLVSGTDGASLQELAKVFDSTATYINSMLVKNFNHRITELTQEKARAGVATTPFQRTALNFA